MLVWLEVLPVIWYVRILPKVRLLLLKKPLHVLSRKPKKPARLKRKKRCSKLKEEIHRLRTEVERENKDRSYRASAFRAQIAPKEKILIKSWNPTKRRKSSLLIRKNKLKASQNKVEEL